jgi:hypothetical protein
LFVGVVVLEDGAYGPQDLEILVLARVKIVERFFVCGMAVRESEIDANGEVDLTAAKDVLEERVPPFNVARVEGKVPFTFDCKFMLTVFKHGQGHVRQGANNLVTTVLL